ncbi:MAG: MFS transporter [Candidatus Aenigmatarchaeota archaeon]
MKKHYLISAFQTAPQSAAGVFIPLMAFAFGATAFEIGIITMLSYVSRFISEFYFGRMSDMVGRRRVFVKVGLLVSSLAFLLHTLMYDVMTIIAVRMILGFTLGRFYYPLVAQVSSHERFGKKLGRFSSYGSLGWVGGLVMAAVLVEYNTIFLMGAVLMFVAFLFSVLLPDARESKIKIPLFPRDIIRKNKSLYLSVIARHIGAHSVWVVFPIYLMQNGLDKTGIALLLAVNPIVQIFFTQIVGHMSEKKSETIFIKASFLVSATAFLMFLLFTNPTLLALGMGVIGISWSFLWIGSLINLSHKNSERSTATGLLGSALGISAVIGPIIGGVLATVFGYEATFVFAVVCSLAAFAMSLRI